MDDTNYAWAGVVNLQSSHGLSANVVLGLFGDEVHAVRIVHASSRGERRRIVWFFFFMFQYAADLQVELVRHSQATIIRDECRDNFVHK
jgi:hypothetical protein